MKRYASIIALTAWLLLAAGCAKMTDVQSFLIGTPKQLQDRQIIVTLSEDIRKQWRDIHAEILDRFDVQAAGEFPLTAIRVNCLVYRVSELVEIDEIIRRLSRDDRIQLVQTNQVFANLSTGDGHDYQQLSYGPKLIQADKAQRWATGKGVTVAVIDTGADTEHPDLKGHIANTENFVQGGAARFNEDSHGTGVVGVIAAGANDGIGIDGIAPDAKVDLYKACWHAKPGAGKALCSSWTLAKAIDKAINTGGRIINLSLNGPKDPLLEQLLSAADQRNIVLVAAAADKAPEPGFPASLDFVIPVISSGVQGEIIKTPWRTLLPTVSAPGVDILTTAPHGGYGFLSGSSLATAHVSGVVALLLQIKPDVTPKQVKALVRQSGQDGTAGEAETVLINACRALAATGAAVEC